MMAFVTPLSRKASLAIVLATMMMAGISYPAKIADACGGSCGPILNRCDSSCINVSQGQRDDTIEHIKNEFLEHKQWMIQDVFEAKLLPSLMLFAEQMTATAMYQTLMIGAMLDAKHQLESQRLFQQMMAQAHKDYQPSEGMCTFGTVTRSLASADRGRELTANVLSTRGIQRELLNGDGISSNGRVSDFSSRVRQYIDLYCDPLDNGEGLASLCPAGSRDPSRLNNDINYTKIFDSALTLKIDFTPDGNDDHAANEPAGNVSADEEDIFALAANLYAHDVAVSTPPTFLTSSDGEVNPRGANHYMNIRSVAAKRSVARNSFNAIAAMKSQGQGEVQPYFGAILAGFGMTDEQINEYLGTRPGYDASMKVLTKLIYQNPTFFSNLYDKPANVSRSLAAMTSIGLMQRRDIYRSILRTEAVLAVMLETALIEQQDKVANEIPRLNDDGELVELAPAEAP